MVVRLPPALLDIGPTELSFNPVLTPPLWGGTEAEDQACLGRIFHTEGWGREEKFLHSSNLKALLLLHLLSSQNRMVYHKDEISN